MSTSSHPRAGLRILAVVATAFGVVAVLAALALPVVLGSSGMSVVGGRPVHDAPLLGPAQQAPGSGSDLASGSGSGSGSFTQADGVLPEGVTAGDDRYPGVTHLDPALRSALLAAGADADATEGIRLEITSGWRSPAYQAGLVQDAIAEYGSAEQAERWVASPETSLHVAGQAVDVGPWEGALWLADHGVEYGLCLVYVNEPWHFELRPDAVSAGCPDRYLDPTEDPRLHP